MNGTKIILRHDKLQEAAKEFLLKTKGHKKFSFYGTMGAGKTTFITALCKELNSTDLVSSPTFSIVNEYNTLSNDIIYHFDFYRIKEPEELYDIGFEEYTDKNTWIFIEWPEKAPEIIPEDFIEVKIHVAENGYREIFFPNIA